MALKAVILDMGGTLVTGTLDSEGYQQAVKRVMDMHGYNFQLRDVKRMIAAGLTELEKARSRNKDMLFNDVYGIALKKLGVPPSEEILEDIHQEFRNHFRSSLLPCVEDVLKELKQSYKLAILSNSMSDQPRLFLQQQGLDTYFDLILCSGEVGVRKPDPRVFNHVLEKLGVEAGETVHVGDSVEADMVGAKNAGITGVWIRGGNGSWPGYSVRSVCELPRLLREIEGNH